jgi:hypothetical protein
MFIRHIPGTPSPSPSITPPDSTDSQCPGIAPGPARATCLCRNRAPGRYQDTALRCTGGAWCYSGGSQYVVCPTGTLYDTAAGGVCNWASNVRCDGCVASGRSARRAGARVSCGDGASGRVPCVPLSLTALVANVSAVPAQSAEQRAQQVAAAAALAEYARVTAAATEGTPTAVAAADAPADVAATAAAGVPDGVEAGVSVSGGAAAASDPVAVGASAAAESG